MVLTETGFTVLDKFSTVEPGVLTVQQLCGETGPTTGSLRHALHRLSYTGLALVSLPDPPAWRATSRGHLTVNNNRQDQHYIATWVPQ